MQVGATSDSYVDGTAQSAHRAADVQTVAHQLCFDRAGSGRRQSRGFKGAGQNAGQHQLGFGQQLPAQFTAAVIHSMNIDV